MKPTIQFHRGLMSLAGGCATLLLALASANLASAQTNTGPGSTNGSNAGASITSGTDNSAYGFSALQFTKTGIRNTAVGSLALKNNIAGNSNTAVGYGALTANTAGNNTALGYQALFKNTSGDFNVAIGDGALLNNTTGSGNIALGEDAGFNLTVGDNNICIGNKGVAGQSGIIRIGTAGTHTSTYLTGVIRGNGSGLTNLGANHLASGTVNDARLSSNVALRAGGNTFTGNQIISSGNVGIGTTSPTQAKLVVNGTGGTDTIGTHANWNFDGGHTNLSGGTVSDLSIKASDWLDASGFRAFSDIRIKNVIGQSDCSADLATLLGIEITDYRYKDVIGKGSAPKKKVIAQQVEKVFPQAVSKSTDVVPDIYQKATVKDGWVELATDLKAGERVRLIGEKEEGIHEVLEVREGAFRTTFRPATEKIFVYGREVKDFRAVDYEAIAMLNVSATQQIKKEKDAEVKALQEENAALRARLDAQDKRLAALEGSDQAREQRVARHGNARNKRPAVAVNASLDLK